MPTPAPPTLIDLELARRLAAGGVRWDPADGDRFTIPGKDLDAAVFVVAPMVVDVVRADGRALLRFNGTVEWALDSVQQDEVIWLPSEEQVRALLGGTFRTLTATADGYRVEVEIAGVRHRAEARSVVDAYAVALLLMAEPD